MILTLIKLLLELFCAPRTSGDDPPYTTLVERCRKCSPHERG